MLFENYKSNAEAEKRIEYAKPLKPYIMKRGIIILVGMLMMVSTVEAKNGKLSTNNIGLRYDDNAVSFVERGIKFYVFLNGDFDFNSQHKNRYYDYNGRRTKKPGVRIERDYNGNIKRVENVFINYDHRGNVKRIGNVFMNYTRGNLTKVGGLRISYNRWGDPRFHGNVKNNNFYDNDSGFNVSIGFGDVCEYNDAYFYRNDFRNNYYKVKEDHNFYYYKAKPNAKIGKRSSVLKRRKAAKKVHKKTTPKRSTEYKKKSIKKKENPIRKRRS